VGVSGWSLGAGLLSVNLLFTYRSVTGSAPSLTANSFGQSLWFFVTNIQLGQYLALNLLVATVLTIAALMVRRLVATMSLAGLGVASSVPLALTGHAAGIQGHSMAVNASVCTCWVPVPGSVA
jgi:putative copper resistance protein D